MLVTIGLSLNDNGVPYSDAYGTGMLVNPLDGQIAFFAVEGGFTREPRVRRKNGWIKWVPNSTSPVPLTGSRVVEPSLA